VHQLQKKPRIFGSNGFSDIVIFLFLGFPDFKPLRPLPSPDPVP
jgi:hypothetical protein